MDTKTLHITGTQALMLHRAARVGEIVRAVPADVHTIAPPPLRAQTIDELGLTRLTEWLAVTGENPLHVLSPSADQRCRTALVRSQVMRHELPSGSFLELTAGNDAKKSLVPSSDIRVIIDAPPLILTNMSQELSEMIHKGKIDELEARLRLIALGNELCGSYARDPFNPQVGHCHYDGIGECNRFFAPDEVRTTLSQMSGMKGVGRARHASQYTLDHSGSPMETYIDMALFLPPRLGGLGMPTPLLNKMLNVPKETLAELKHASIRPDIQWPDFSTLAEYLGDKEHASKKARIEDKNRGQDYTTAGYASFFLMFDDVSNQNALNDTAKMLAGTLEARGATNALKRFERTHSKKGFIEKQTRLVATLLPPITRYDEGGY